MTAATDNAEFLRRLADAIATIPKDEVVIDFHADAGVHFTDIEVCSHGRRRELSFGTMDFRMETTREHDPMAVRTWRYARFPDGSRWVMTNERSHLPAVCPDDVMRWFRRNKMT